MEIAINILWILVGCYAFTYISDYIKERIQKRELADKEPKNRIVHCVYNCVDLPIHDKK